MRPAPIVGSHARRSVARRGRVLAGHSTTSSWSRLAVLSFGSCSSRPTSAPRSAWRAIGACLAPSPSAWPSTRALGPRRQLQLPACGARGFIAAIAGPREGADPVQHGRHGGQAGHGHSCRRSCWVGRQAVAGLQPSCRAARPVGPALAALLPRCSSFVAGGLRRSRRGPFVVRSCQGPAVGGSGFAFGLRRP